MVLLFVPSTVLRHGAKSRLSHKPPSWGARSAKCHLSWHAFQVGCNHDCTVLPGPESGLFLLDTEMKAGFSRDGCFGQSFILLSTSVMFAHALGLFCPPPLLSPMILIPEPAPPPQFAHLPVLLVLDKQGFCLPWHPSVFIFWREGQKEDEGLEVCGEKFLEDVPGLCSQGTSCSQCERGTLSMRSISMTIIFILQQSGSRQHSAGGGSGAFSSDSLHPV